MKKVFSIIGSYFLKGLLYTVPLAITAYVIYQVFIFFDRIITIPYDIPGLGIISLFLFITLMGILGSSVIVQPLSRKIVAFIEKTPFLKTIYSAVKDLVSTFVEKKSSFRVPVLIKVSEDSNLQKIGFITEEDLSSLGINDDSKVAVYIPHSYAFSGLLYIVERKNITIIDQKASDVMKFIVSGGVAHLESSKEENNERSDH
jgi:uncharacterized membrane protein